MEDRFKSRTEFTKNLFKDRSDIDWFGHIGYHKMANGKVAKIYIDIAGVSGTYVGVRTEIINKDEGKVDQLFIQFSDVMEMTDFRADEYSDLRVISHCGWDWYIRRPKDENAMSKAIFDYIKIME